MTITAVYIYQCLIFLFKHTDQITTSSISYNYETPYININLPRHRLATMMINTLYIVSLPSLK